MVRLLIFLTVLYGAWLLALYFLQEKLIFPGAYMRHDAVDAPPPDTITLRVDTSDTTYTEGWLLPGHGDGPRPLLVFLHGNGERIDDWPWRLRPYRDKGFSVLLCEYRGYGNSGGTPGEAACVADTLALIEQAVAREDVANKVVIHGRSIGGSVAAQVGGQRELHGLILESAPASLTRLTAGYLAPPFLLRHPFRGADALRGTTFPVLILHGRYDDTVPPKHAKLLHEAMPHATLVLYEAHHNNLPPDGQYDHYWQALLTLAQEAVAE